MSELSKSKLKYFRSLKIKKYRQQEKKFIIEGIKFCQEAVNSAVKIDAFLYCPQIVSRETLTTILATCESESIPCYELTQDMVQALSDTVNSQGVFCILNELDYNLVHSQSSIFLVLDSVNDPGNAGSIIRTADWFGLDGVILGENSVELYNEKLLRATMGSIFHLPIISTQNLAQEISTLKNNGFTVFGADVRGEFYHKQIQYSTPEILVIGNESHGLSDELLTLCDYRIKIPARGKAESLNAAVATGIILNEMVFEYGI
ncbi:hypothetical protein GF337_11490 [candidate division KSB1 bacterium]|nr:hypothetical protein [candidate division KSB1 bacterium]